MLSIARRDSYELGRPLLELPERSAFEATELSLGTPVVYHIVRIPCELTETLRTRIESALLPFASVCHPRLPLLSDAWIDEAAREVHYVFLGPLCRHLSIESPGIFRDEALRFTAMEDSLDALAALHDVEIPHGQFRPECLGVSADGYLHLISPGFGHRLVELAREDPERQMAVALTLSSNTAMRDVAEWANSVVSMMLGRPLLNYDFDEWDDNELQRSAAAMADLFGASGRLEVMLRCLAGRTVEARGFANARLAYEALAKVKD
jgi:hypothetical protein